MGKKDLFTGFCRKKDRPWKPYLRNIEKLVYLDTASHYFQSELSDTVAQYLID